MNAPPDFALAKWNARLFVFNPKCVEVFGMLLVNRSFALNWPRFAWTSLGYTKLLLLFYCFIINSCKCLRNEFDIKRIVYQRLQCNFEANRILLQYSFIYLKNKFHQWKIKLAMIGKQTQRSMETGLLTFGGVSTTKGCSSASSASK